MFFHIANQHQENYPCHWQLGGFCVSTDTGWFMTIHGNATILYKGYADSADLAVLLPDIVVQTTPHILGNFCAMVLVDNTLTIQTDRYRSFPIYINSDSINNLIPSNRTAWTDQLVTVHSDLAVTQNTFDVIGPTDLVPSNIDQIDKLLTNKIQTFVLHNQLPIRVFLSGGVDTLLFYSYLRRLNIKHELVWNLHTDLDEFYLANSDDLQKHWGYQQIHHWRESCVLASGSPGDEFTLRSPNTANLFLLNHGTSIPEQLNLQNNCLHREYFKRFENTELFNCQQENFKPSENIVWDICNNIVNDWQHWHLGNTTTWTPLRDLELTKLILLLPFDQVVSQIMNSSISRKLIERNVPGLTRVLSDQKNTGNVFRNLQGLLNHECQDV
jgi:hypothetical protein